MPFGRCRVLKHKEEADPTKEERENGSHRTSIGQKIPETLKTKKNGGKHEE
jgi:hypothetical protein